MRSYTHLRIFGILGNLGPNTPSHGKGHIKLIQSLQLNISHQMTPYPSFKVIWGSFVTEYLGHWGNLGRLDPYTSNQSMRVIHRKPLKVFNSTFHVKWGLTQVQKLFEGGVIPVLVYLGIKASQSSKENSQIKGMDTQKVIQSVKLNISNQMKPYSNLNTIWGLIYTCFSVFWANQGNWDQIPHIMGMSIKVLNSTFDISLIQM